MIRGTKVRNPSKLSKINDPLHQDDASAGHARVLAFVASLAAADCFVLFCLFCVALLFQGWINIACALGVCRRRPSVLIMNATHGTINMAGPLFAHGPAATTIGTLRSIHIARQGLLLTIASHCYAGRVIKARCDGSRHRGQGRCALSERAASAYKCLVCRGGRRGWAARKGLQRPGGLTVEVGFSPCLGTQSPLLS